MNFRDHVSVSPAPRMKRLPVRGMKRLRTPALGPGEANVFIRLFTPDGEEVAKRCAHNIFVEYGQDWIAHLISLNTAGTTFREDRVCYVGFGIGGVAQSHAADDIRGVSPGAIYSYPGFPNDWVGGSGTGDPVQTATDPTVTALEWPVEITAGVYYKQINQPATFPGTGIVRYTAVFGKHDISFGAYAEVPISEIMLFTNGVTDLTVPPVVAGALPLEKFGVAYHQFAPLPKVADFVLQIDWELRFS